MLWRMTVLSFFYAFGIKEEDTEVGRQPGRGWVTG